MIFNQTRQIDKIQIPIVSICNRRCPHCCARDQLTWYNKNIEHVEIELNELQFVGATIGSISRIEITGGEPTMHSKFEEITKKLPDIFDCKHFMLVSNGWLFKKDPTKLPLLLSYQEVLITHYGDDFSKEHGGNSNTNEVEIIKEFIKKEGHPNFRAIELKRHVPHIGPPYKGNPCDQFYSSMISYHKGYLYGCCVAWSLPYQGKGIPLTSDWRENLYKIDVPCEHCFLSV